MPVSRRFAYRGVHLLVIPQPDGSIACIPEWMTHEQAAHFKLLEPSFSLDNLRSMRVEIDVLLAFLSSESTGDKDGHETQTRRFRRLATGTVRPRKAEDRANGAQTQQLAKLVEALLVEIAVALATGEAGNEQDNH